MVWRCLMNFAIRARAPLVASGIELVQRDLPFLRARSRPQAWWTWVIIGESLRVRKSLMRMRIDGSIV